jgi:hypothetical protein
LWAGFELASYRPFFCRTIRKPSSSRDALQIGELGQLGSETSNWWSPRRLSDFRRVRSCASSVSLGAILPETSLNAWKSLHVPNSTLCAASIRDDRNVPHFSSGDDERSRRPACPSRDRRPPAQVTTRSDQMRRSARCRSLDMRDSYCDFGLNTESSTKAGTSRFEKKQRDRSVPSPFDV